MQTKQPRCLDKLGKEIGLTRKEEWIKQAGKEIGLTRKRERAYQKRMAG